MANYYGVINTLAVQTGATSVSATGPSAWSTAGYVNGRMKANVDYIVMAAQASGSVIYMGTKLPVGAMVLFHVISTTDAVGSLTVSIGDLDSATRYASAATSLQAAGAFVISGVSGGVPYIIGTNPSSGGVSTATAADNDQQIILTTGGASLGASGTITLITVYVTD